MIKRRFIAAEQPKNQSRIIWFFVRWLLERVFMIDGGDKKHTENVRDADTIRVFCVLQRVGLNK